MQQRKSSSDKTSHTAGSSVKISRRRSRKSNSVIHVTLRPKRDIKSKSRESTPNNNHSINLSDHPTILRIDSQRVKSSKIDFLNRYDHGLHRKKKTNKRYWRQKCRSCPIISLVCLFLSSVLAAIILAVILTKNKGSKNDSGTSMPTCDSLQWDPIGTIVTVNSTSGNGPNQFGSIEDIFVDLYGALYIVDGVYHRVQQWLPNATSGTTIAGITGVPGTNNSLLCMPNSIYIDEQQNMYIWNRGYNRLVKWIVGASTGTTIPVPSSYIYGVDIFVDKNGYFYLCSVYNSCVMKNHLYSTTYQIAAGGSSTGYSSSQLNNPLGISVDPVSFTIYVANTNSHTIVAWPSGASEGTIVVGSNGTAGSIDSMLRNPQSVTRDIYGNLYVSDSGNNRVLFFCQNPATMNGRNIAGINLYQPGDIALDSQMNLYVAEPNYYRVWKFSRLF